MLKSTREIFKDNLSERRKKKFPTQDEFAQKLEMGERGYQKYEQGKAWPSPERLDKMCKLLGCDLEDLVCEIPDDQSRLRQAYRDASDARKALVMAAATDDPVDKARFQQLKGVLASEAGAMIEEVQRLSDASPQAKKETPGTSRKPSRP